MKLDTFCFASIFRVMALDHFELCKSCEHSSHTAGRIFDKLCTHARTIMKICMKAKNNVVVEIVSELWSLIISNYVNLVRATYCVVAYIRLCHHWHSCCLFVTCCLKGGLSVCACINFSVYITISPTENMKVLAYLWIQNISDYI